MSSIKGAMIFGKRGKLDPLFIFLFEVVEKVAPVAYKFSL